MMNDAMQPGITDYRRTLEMSISREEFLRLLPAAVGTFEISDRGGAWRVSPAHGAQLESSPARGPVPASWSIDLFPLPPLQFGSSLVPRHRVEVVIPGCREDERKAFVERFERAYLRGGG